MSEKRSQGRYITIQITLVVSCLLLFFCPSRRSPLGSYRGLAARSFVLLPSGRQIRSVASRSVARKEGAPAESRPTRSENRHDEEPGESEAALGLYPASVPHAATQRKDLPSKSELRLHS